MRKIFAIAFAMLMLGFAVPAVSADETVTREYTLAMGVSPGFALIMCLGPPEQQVCEDAGIAPIGGYDGRRTGSDVLTNALVSINDDAFGTTTFTSICVYTDDHSICDEEVGDVTGSGCGSFLLIIPTGVTNANPVAGFVYNAHVSDDLDTCFGSSGTAVINYF